jgi:hypothetical protein
MDRHSQAPHSQQRYRRPAHRSHKHSTPPPPPARKPTARSQTQMNRPQNIPPPQKPSACSHTHSNRRDDSPPPRKPSARSRSLSRIPSLRSGSACSATPLGSRLAPLTARSFGGLPAVGRPAHGSVCSRLRRSLVRRPPCGRPPGSRLGLLAAPPLANRRRSRWSRRPARGSSLPLVGPRGSRVVVPGGHSSRSPVRRRSLTVAPPAARSLRGLPSVGLAARRSPIPWRSRSFAPRTPRPGLALSFHQELVWTDLQHKTWQYAWRALAGGRRGPPSRPPAGTVRGKSEAGATRPPNESAGEERGAVAVLYLADSKGETGYGKHDEASTATEGSRAQRAVARRDRRERLGQANGERSEP